MQAIFKCVLWIFVLPLLLLSCKNGETDKMRLTSTCWKLVQLNRQNLFVPLDDDNYTITFSDTTFVGKTECNVFNGNYSFKHIDRLKLNINSSTHRLCRDVASEELFVRVLNEATRIEFRGDTLMFICKHQGCATFVPYDIHSTQLVSDEMKAVVGLYKGLYPSTDGPGVNVTLQLNDNGTYRLIMVNVVNNIRFSKEGYFNVINNKLSLLSDEGPQVFAIKGQYLIQLSANGEPIGGQLADSYMLIKTY